LVSGFNPVTIVLTDTAVVPAPASIEAVLLAIPAVSPYWKRTVVSTPPGFTVPERVTVVVVVPLPEPVVAVGCELVVNVCSDP
jgi:hypothetical protein